MNTNHGQPLQRSIDTPRPVASRYARRAAGRRRNSRGPWAGLLEALVADGVCCGQHTEALGDHRKFRR